MPKTEIEVISNSESQSKFCRFSFFSSNNSVLLSQCSICMKRGFPFNSRIDVIIVSAVSMETDVLFKDTNLPNWNAFIMCE